MIQRTTGQILHRLTGAIAMLSLSPTEEEFFRAGEKPHAPHDPKHPHHDFSDLDAGFQRPTLWRAVVGWLRGERTRHHPD